ncbi:MAG: hypothetical protein ACE5Z5_00925 [Candidatus Bathyarchaeia archaeon]
MSGRSCRDCIHHQSVSFVHPKGRLRGGDVIFCRNFGQVFNVNVAERCEEFEETRE